MFEIVCSSRSLASKAFRASEWLLKSTYACEASKLRKVEFVCIGQPWTTAQTKVSCFTCLTTTSTPLVHVYIFLMASHPFTSFHVRCVKHFEVISQHDCQPCPLVFAEDPGEETPTTAKFNMQLLIYSGPAESSVSQVHTRDILSP